MKTTPQYTAELMMLRTHTMAIIENSCVRDMFTDKILDRYSIKGTTDYYQCLQNEVILTMAEKLKLEIWLDVPSTSVFFIYKLPVNIILRCLIKETKYEERFHYNREDNEIEYIFKEDKEDKEDEDTEDSKYIEESDDAFVDRVIKETQEIKTHVESLGQAKNYNIDTLNTATSCVHDRVHHRLMCRLDEEKIEYLSHNLKDIGVYLKYQNHIFPSNMNNIPDKVRDTVGGLFEREKENLYSNGITETILNEICCCPDAFLEIMMLDRFEDIEPHLIASKQKQKLEEAIREEEMREDKIIEKEKKRLLKKEEKKMRERDFNESYDKLLTIIGMTREKNDVL